MAYEVCMHFKTYYSGVSTDILLFSKKYSELKDAITKFRNLSKNASEVDNWKKTRSRIKEAKLPVLDPKDFADGYSKFLPFMNATDRYYCHRELQQTFGFDSESLVVLIQDPDTADIIKKT